MQNAQRWRWLIALLTVVALMGAACGGGEEETDTGTGDNGTQEEEFPADSTMAALQEEGSITIGVKFDVPPFGFVRPGEDEPQGFDVDLGNIIADRLGVEAEFVEAISDNRIPFLKDGTVDLILSTMTITTDRDAEIDFSRPYFIAHQRLLVPEGSDIKGLDDLAGKTVCTVLGSTGESNLKEKAPDAKRRTVDAYSECFELLQNGAVDAEISDDVILTGQIIQDDSLQLVGPELTTEPYGVGIPDGQTDMQEFIDGVLQDIFDSGEWDEMYDEWVGQYTGQEPDHPSRLTLQDALDLFPCVEFC
ncbi:MAG TPA: glutamate ABC transporter substrate-binding protein [Actinomycetota bacterium]|nr:glutamate ABC transporter substrate-binding protein [Actinomycetota bacterium]